MSILRWKIAAAALCFALPAASAPAPWYKWMSQYDRTIVCTQSSPGEGWILYDGPFKDARCRVPGQYKN